LSSTRLLIVKTPPGLARFVTSGGNRQSRLDAFRMPESKTETATAGPRAPSQGSPDEPTHTPHSAPSTKQEPPPLPRFTKDDEDRLHRSVVEGLEAAGFQRPRITLHLRTHSSLRASLSQDRAGKIVPGEPLTIELTDGYALAPPQAVAGLAASLGQSVMGRRKPNELSRMLIEYHDLWQRSREGRALQSRIRRHRARKQGRGPHGTAHNLEDIKDRLVARFFAGHIDDVNITWSSREGYTTLGHHDGDLDTIVINRSLDHADVPESIVAYILYHELLHHTLGIQESPGGRRSLHPPSFRRRERRFPNWQTADKYLESMCSRRRPPTYRRAPQAWRVLWDEPWDRVPLAPRQGETVERGDPAP
jgi:hypothetical protein